MAKIKTTHSWLARVWRRLVATFRGSAEVSNLRNPEGWLLETLGGRDTAAGVHLDGSKLISYAPIWYGVNRISATIAHLPLHLYERRSAREIVQIDDAPAIDVLRHPNEMMTGGMVRQLLLVHAIIYGNGRAYIERERGRPAGLVPLLPQQTYTVLAEGRKWHATRNTLTGEYVVLDDADVVHLVGISPDGIVGWGLIHMAAESVGLGLAAEEHSARHFRNAAVPAMVLQAPPGVLRNEAEAEQFIQRWNEYHRGLSKSHRVALLREGITAQVLASTGRDSQWIEQRLFQRQDAALWLGLDRMPGDNSSISYNSLEQQNTAFVQYCLTPWVKRLEEQLEAKLLAPAEQRRRYFRHNLAALLRGTTEERYRVYQIAIQNRILSPNEARAMEELPPYEGGDTFANPAITPGTPPGSDPPATAPPTPPADAAADNAAPAAARAYAELVRANLRQIVQTEMQRAIDAATKPQKFLSWLDQFYSERGFALRLMATIITAGGTRQMAQKYVRQSHQRLLELSGQCTADELPAAVAREVQTWPQRAEALAAAIVSQQKEGKDAHDPDLRRDRT